METEFNLEYKVALRKSLELYEVLLEKAEKAESRDDLNTLIDMINNFSLDLAYMDASDDWTEWLGERMHRTWLDEGKE